MSKRTYTPTYPAELRERGARLFREHRAEYGSDNAECRAIAPKLGCSPDSLRTWCRRAEIDAQRRQLQDARLQVEEDVRAELVGEVDATLAQVSAAVAQLQRAEGGMSGMYNEMTYFNGVEEKVEDMLKHAPEWGGPSTYPHMAAGWAVCFDSPFMWTKQVPSNYGGTRQGTQLT